MNIRTFILFLVVGVLFFSCTKEEIDNRLGSATGDATRITLALKSERQQLNEKQGRAQTNRAMEFPYGVPTTGNMIGSEIFSPQDESLITNVHILVFDPTGQIVSNNYIGELNFSETATIVSETYCGENMDVWVVANGDVNDTEETHLKDELDKVESINDLQTLLISTNGNGLSRSDRLTMVGSSTITIAPSMEPIPIQMHYLAAKVTVNVTDNTPDDVEITIIGWDMVNIPKRTYLKERMKEDAVNGTVSADYLTTAEEYPFETISTKSWGQSFYLFENRRGNRVDRPLPINPSERYPEMSVNDNNQRGKAWYAPPGATYMLIYGTYNKSGQMNNVVYKIYLGENPVDNYDIKRGKHYKYNVNVNGLNDIHIDTNIDWGTSDFTVQLGENLQMDAHPDFRVFRIGGIATDNDTPAHATIEVLDADGNPCDWLALSPMDIYRHGVKQSGNANQPFGPEAVGYYVRTMYSNTIVDESTLADATYRMARRITHIPFNQITVSTYQDVILYADELEDSNGERRGKVKITYYKGADADIVAGVQHFEVIQQGPIKISDNLYVERYEESAMYLHPDPNFGVQNTSTMQWGHNDGNMLYTVYDRFCNGNFLTANAVYKTVAPRNGMNTPQWTTATYGQYYRATYPRTGNPITESSGTATTGYPYYYPDLTVSTPPTDYFHPIYNTSAARYCHEKNRDKNGDGIIDANETVWYLPSFSDMGAILTASLTSSPLTQNPLNGVYWSSTEVDGNQSWASFFASYPLPSGNNKYDKTTSLRVRCVRGAGTVMEEPYINPTADIGVGGPNNGSRLNIHSNPAFELPWTITSSAPDWLKIATDVNGTGAAITQTGIGPAALYAYAEENVTGASRIGTITLTQQGFTTTATTKVTQDGVLSATINITSINLRFHAGESGAFTIDNRGTNLKWTVKSNQGWLTIAQDAIGANAANSQTGTGNVTLYAFVASKNTSNTNRTASITLEREYQMSPNIAVTQEKLQPYRPQKHNGWATSNIYWDSKNGRLTFDEVIGDSYYQGVYFVWGSLVAISPEFPYNPAGAILFSPERVPDVNNLPSVGTNLNAADEQDRNLVLEAHDPQNNIGDICRYLTTRGWAPGSKQGVKWRLPTANEFKELLSAKSTGNTGLCTPILRDGKMNLRLFFQFTLGGYILPSNGNVPIYNTQPGKEFGAGLSGSYLTGSWAGGSEQNAWWAGWAEQKKAYVLATPHIYAAGVRCVRE